MLTACGASIVYLNDVRRGCFIMGKQGLLDSPDKSLSSRSRGCFRLLAVLSLLLLVVVWRNSPLSTCQSILHFSHRLVPTKNVAETLQHSSVSWKACEGQPDFLCASMSVPKDYTNSSSGRASIALAKLPASVPTREKLGSIFLNPGEFF